jgi:hypothetical protein
MKPSKAVREYLAALAKKGGNARAEALTAAQRKQIASDAAKARWENKRGERKAKGKK